MGDGDKGALLRREGLYSSHIVEWRRARDVAVVDGLSPRTRQPATTPDAAALAKANCRIQRLEADLAKHKLALEIAGKAHALLEMLAESACREQAQAVIDACVADLVPLIGTEAACRAAGKAKATHYRANQPPKLGPLPPRPTPANALTEVEVDRLLELLRSERFRDLAPAQALVMLLDDDVYLASISTMYRVLRSNGEVRERRRQATHPTRSRPELMASGPNQCWSWDITKLRGPDRGVWFDLYVIIDIFSRYVVDWMVAPGESAELAKAFIAQAVAGQGVAEGTLTIHADRGTSMTSKPVAELLADLGIGRTHSRPHVSNDNPYSESAFKTLKYCPAFPERFGCIEDAGSSASSSSPTTTTNIATPASACTPRPRSITARPPRSGPSGRSHSTPPTPPTPAASATAGPRRRSSPRWPGSTSPRSRTTHRRRTENSSQRS